MEQNAVVAFEDYYLTLLSDIQLISVSQLLVNHTYTIEFISYDNIEVKVNRAALVNIPVERNNPYRNARNQILRDNPHIDYNIKPVFCFVLNREIDQNNQFKFIVAREPFDDENEEANKRVKIYFDDGFCSSPSLRDNEILPAFKFHGIDKIQFSLQKVYRCEQNEIPKLKFCLKNGQECEKISRINSIFEDIPVLSFENLPIGFR